MKKLNLLVLLFLSLVCHVSSAAIFITSDNISLYAPDDYIPLTPKEINRNLTVGKINTEFVLANESRTSTIALGYEDTTFSEDFMPKLTNAFQQYFDKKFSISQWISHEVRTVNGQKWIYLEFIWATRGVNVRTIMLATPYQGRTVMFALTTLAKDFKANETTIRKSINSIQLP